MSDAGINEKLCTNVDPPHRFIRIERFIVRMLEARHNEAEVVGLNKGKSEKTEEEKKRIIPPITV